MFQVVGQFVDFSPNPQFPLHQLAYGGDFEAMETRLKELRKSAPASVCAPDLNGYTPLTCAALAGHVAIVRLLLSDGNAMAPTRDGYTALHMLAASCEASKKNNYDKVIRQLAAIAESLVPAPVTAPADSPLLVAVDAANMVAVRALLETRGSAWIDSKTVVLGWSAMHLAAKHGSVPLLRLLVQHGASPFVASECIGRPLDVAQCARNAEAEQYLAELDRDAAATLAVAAAAKYRDLRPMLKAAPANLAAVDANGLTVLHHLCAQAATSTVQWLLEERKLRASLDLDARDSRQWSALHYSASSGDPQLVLLMLIHGADPHLATASQSTPLHFLTACQASTPDESERLMACLQQMRAMRCDFNARNSRGETPLLIACGRGNTNFVGMLLQFTEVDLGVTDAAGSNATVLAKRGGSRLIVEALEARGVFDPSAPAPRGGAVADSLLADNHSMAMASMALSTRNPSAILVADTSHSPPLSPSPPMSPRIDAVHGAAPDCLLRLNDVCLSAVLMRMRARDLVVARRVCRRLASLATRAEVLQAVARRSGLPPVTTMSYMQREFGWIELATLARSTAAPEASASLPVIRMVLLGEPGVGRHSLVHSLITGGECELDAGRDSYSVILLIGTHPFRLVINVPARGSADGLAQCDAVMLCFDASRPETFDQINVWEDLALDARQSADSVRTSIVGTNSDKGVLVSVAMLKSAEHQPVIVCSAALNRNVQTAFQVLLAPLANALRMRTLKRTGNHNTTQAASTTASAAVASDAEPAPGLQKVGSRRAAFMRVFSNSSLKTKK
jgi:ankyrin repeat protein